MVHQHASFAKAYIEGSGRSAKWEPLPNDAKRSAPQFLIPLQSQLLSPKSQRQRPAFCDVTGHSNERTILASIVSSDVACGNKVPTVEFDRSDPELAYIWVGIANSFVIDWIARRRVSTSLNFFIWDLIPFPRLDSTSQEGRAIYKLVRKLSGQLSTKRRGEVRAEIDAIIMASFRLTPPEVALVMSDFPAMDRHHHGTCGRTATRDLALLAFAKIHGMQEPTLDDFGIVDFDGPASLPARVREANATQQFGYVPSQQYARAR